MTKTLLGLNEMRNKIRHKSFFLLLTSGLASQALSIGSYAVLALVSDPAEIGRYSTTVSISTIVTALLSLGFVQAILSSEIEEDALMVFNAYIAILLTISTLVLPISLWLGYLWVGLLPVRIRGIESLAQWALLLALLQAANLSMTALMQRLRRVKEISLLQVIGATLFFITICSFLALDWRGSALSLVKVLALSQIAQLAYGIASLRNSSGCNHLKPTSADKIVLAIRKQSKYILFGSPLPLVNAVSIEMPQIMIVSLFGAGAAGMFALSSKALTMSLSAITSATQKYYYTSIVNSSDCMRKTGETLRQITLVVIPFASYIAVAVPVFLDFLRPADWEELAKYLVILAIPSALWQSPQPFTCWYLFRNVPEQQLQWNCWNLGLRAAAILVGFRLSSESPIASLIGFAGVSILTYSSKIYKTLTLSGMPLYQIFEGALPAFASPLILASFCLCGVVSRRIGGDIVSVLILTALLVGYYSALSRIFRIGKVLVEVPGIPKG